MARIELVVPHGQGRGRYYLASENLWNAVRPARLASAALDDPYPDFANNCAVARGAAFCNGMCR